MVIATLAMACDDTVQEPMMISPDVNVDAVPWVEDKSLVSVSFYDMSGKLIEDPENVQVNQTYDVVIKGDKPMGIYMFKTFGFDFLDEGSANMVIRETHRYRILKTEPGFNQVIMEVFPLYYINEELTRERPQLFIFPRKIS